MTPRSGALSGEPGDHGPLVSVIVPFYNTAEFLEECIRSVLTQDYPALEVLLCDNRSTDGSSRIAERIAGQDPRVRYVRHEEFLSQLDNYNRALTHASPDSEYTKIVQADDWIAPDCIGKMVDVGERHPTAGIVSSFTLCGSSVWNVGLSPERELFEGREVCRRQLLGDSLFLGSQTTVLYRSEIVRSMEPFYPSGVAHFDTYVAFEILREWDLGFVHQVLSYARDRRDSISTRQDAYDPFPYLLFKLALIDRYGEDFLTPDERASVWSSCLRRYYGFLGSRLFTERRSDFWRFHRAGLATIGERLDPLRVTAGAARTLGELLLNPLDTARRVARRMRASRRAGENG